MGQNDQSNSDRTALPLSRAAEVLGITPDALRMRIKRGKAEGFRRDGRVFVYLSEQPNNQANNVRLDETAPPRPDKRDLADIVELQRLELSRLLSENDRLSRRIDQLMKLQDQEQVLRLRRQETIERLGAHIEPPGEGAASGGRRSLEARLRAAEAKVERLKTVIERLIELIERGRASPG